MAVVQLSVPVRNARLDAIETTVGASAILKLFTAALPANCAAANAGTVVSTINLPADYFGNASGGVKSKAGTWEDLLADANGVPLHWRLFDSTGVTCHAQGDVSDNAGTGSLKVDNTNFVAGQPFTITSWSMTDGNA
jgi:hypothetical protein